MSSGDEDILLDSGETSTTSYKNNPEFFMNLERTKRVGWLPAFSDIVYHGENLCMGLHTYTVPSETFPLLCRSPAGTLAWKCHSSRLHSDHFHNDRKCDAFPRLRAGCEDHSRRVQTCITMSSISSCPHFFPCQNPRGVCLHPSSRCFSLFCFAHLNFLSQACTH